MKAELLKAIPHADVDSMRRLLSESPRLLNEELDKRVRTMPIVCFLLAWLSFIAHIIDSALKTGESALAMASRLGLTEVVNLLVNIKLIQVNRTNAVGQH